MIANAAFYVGIVHQLVSQRFDEMENLGFEDARDNFYAAARFGLDARFRWPGSEGVAARDLLADELLPAARAGLAALGIDTDDAGRYIGALETRIGHGQTGAAWQKAGRDSRGGDFFRLMAAYCERQRSGIPVAEWKS
jgi:hypothetical protein